MSVLYGVVIYFLIFLPLAIFFGKLLKGEGVNHAS
jgi:hypothetical protein